MWEVWEVRVLKCRWASLSSWEPLLLDIQFCHTPSLEIGKAVWEGGEGEREGEREGGRGGKAAFVFIRAKGNSQMPKPLVVAI